MSADVPGRIKALDQDVVNKIAAGEIIVAPVHALKELTENAVDAGSTSVEIVVKDGGLKLLQITDNGCGINRDDMSILCERFTTSKLKTFEDLMSMSTYGFRGEALASISHIAHLQVTTKTKESSCAWRAHYANGKLTPAKPGQSAEPKACAGRQGTQVTVEDLFYNVPTRRRAFRSASDEYAKILDFVSRCAVHCAGVAFSCKKHGDVSVSIAVQAPTSKLDRIKQIYGNAVASELLEFDVKDDKWGFRASGFCSSANYHAKKLTLLLFINNRSVESTSIKRAVEQTYSVFLPKGGHPFVYLSLDIDPQRIDVNVHPTKREVNFLNEDEIIDCICNEIRNSMNKVDESRTFTTQTLLPGAKIPTISSDASASSPSRGLVIQSFQPPVPVTPKVMPRTPASKPYENNLVRTDSKVRKITSMLPASGKANASTHVATPDEQVEAQVDGNVALPTEDDMEYEYTDREPTTCRLQSVKELKAQVREAMHSGLTDVFATHTYVGIVDERRRIAAIQSGVKLFLVDYGLICNEYFYQLSLTHFNNFGCIKLDPPLPLRELLLLATENEQAKLTKAGEDPNDLDWDLVVKTVENQLISRRDMLAEYFSLLISEEGQLEGLPLLVKGYTPSMAKLPNFLLRLGPHVDWTEEKPCFHTFLKELAAWYTPEALPPPPQPKPKNSAQSSDEPKNGAGGGEDPSPEESMDESLDGATLAEDPEITKRRDHVHKAVENVLFPGFKSRLVGTKGMMNGLVEVANLKGLYRVFERC